MITNTDFKYFEKAKQVATISDYHPVQVGCIAVYKGHIVAVACNLNKTAGKQAVPPDQSRFHRG